MKKVLFISTLIMVALNTLGQKKLGHLDYEKLVHALPDFDKANQAAGDYFQKLSNRINSIRLELDTESQKFVRDSSTLSKEQKDASIKKQQDLYHQSMAAEQSAQNDYENEKQRLLKPIVERVDKAIKDFAKEKGYEYVFDTKYLLAFPASDDLFEQIKERLLGVKNPK